MAEMKAQGWLPLAGENSYKVLEDRVKTKVKGRSVLPVVEESLEVLEELVIILVNEAVHFVDDVPGVMFHFEVLPKRQRLVRQAQLYNGRNNKWQVRGSLKCQHYYKRT